MIPEAVLKDLDSGSVASNLHFSTSWGKETFIAKLKEPIQDKAVLKRRQLPLMVLAINTVGLFFVIFIKEL